MGALQEKRAEQILEFCRLKRKSYFTTKRSAGKIVDPETNIPYRPHQIGASLKILNKRGILTKISKSRWEIRSYDLNK